MDRNKRAPVGRGAEELRTLPDYTADHTTRPFPIHYSRGRDKYDAYPEQRTAVSFSDFAEAVLADRSSAKGLIWISGPFARNGEGRHHRCRDGVLLRGFIAFDLDGATPDAFAELCMLLGAYSGFGYTTASYTPESPHARYILELSRAVDRAEGIRLGEAMQRRIEAQLGLGVVNLDPSVYRGEQPIFAPLQNAEIMRYHGDPADVDQILKGAPPLEERPGRAERAATIASRDPVVRALTDSKMIKRDHGDGKLSVTCSFAGGHTEPGGESSTVYFLPNFGGVRYGKFVCMHRHCEWRRQESYLRALGLEPKEVWREQAGGAAPYDDLPPVGAYDEAAQEDARRHTAGAKASAGGGEPRPGNGASSRLGGNGFHSGASSSAEDWRAEVERLAKLPPLEYDQVRQEKAEAFGVRVSTVDVEVTRLRRELAGKDAGGQGEAVLFAQIEPWPGPVGGAALLTDLVATFRRYAILPDHADVALALWAIFTHCIDAVNVAPILALTSPEKRCGKSTVLALLRRLARRPLPSANITAPPLFRAVEAWSPTLLIDEADSFLRNSDELRGVLNSGHTRDSAFVIRTVGEDHEPRRFSTWGAKAIALIGKLPDTLADRSIEVQLKRKLPSESVEKVRRANPDLFLSLARRCARWAADHIDEIRAARPSMPDGLHDRAEDNWEPLFAIADLAACPEQARAAALALSGGDEDTRGLGTELLGDIRVVFDDRSVDRISSEDLVLALVALEERRWSEYSHGKPLTKAKLARLLRPYGVVSRSVRLPDGRTPKGYLLEQFTDSFARYLPTKASHRHKQGGARDPEDFESATADGCSACENGPEPSCGAGCGGVADSKPPP